MKQALTVLVGVLAGFLLAGALFWVVRSPAGQPIVLQPAPTEEPIAVHVVGAVPRPGFYELAEGSRVQDAIDAAGGSLAAADVNALNLAALLEDGQKLEIPYKAGQEPVDDEGSSLQTEEPVDNETADLININTATLAELDSLPGIGPTTAQKIIDYRNENGPFQQIEDLMNVSGIGPATFEGISNLITAE